MYIEQNPLAYNSRASADWPIEVRHNFVHRGSESAVLTVTMCSASCLLQQEAHQHPRRVPVPLQGLQIAPPTTANVVLGVGLGRAT